ncbi:RHS repeat-associated core domain-containing protein [Pseudomonas sp. NPDC089996]|uniref:RHS repeat-associated core domain-containing protein n=1 Tax=Pseudomonas sp. NPDC089996 TaxID=3364474 RepID=UPI00381D5EBA
MKKNDSFRKIFYQNRTPTTLVGSSVSTSLFRSFVKLLAFTRTDKPHITLIAGDQNNSVLFTSTDKQRQALAYSPYGYSLPAADCPVGFNGELIDRALSAYSLGQGFRYYLQNCGRFNSPDTISPFCILNGYAYCGGDPINSIDPSGHMPLRLDPLIGYKGQPVVVKKQLKLIEQTRSIEQLSPSLRSAPRTKIQAEMIDKSASEMYDKIIKAKVDLKLHDNKIKRARANYNKARYDLHYANGDSRGWKYEKDLNWDRKYYKSELLSLESSREDKRLIKKTKISEAINTHNKLAEELGFDLFNRDKMYPYEYLKDLRGKLDHRERTYSERTILPFRY